MNPSARLSANEVSIVKLDVLDNIPYLAENVFAWQAVLRRINQGLGTGSCR